jgi:hypothetical protein
MNARATELPELIIEPLVRAALLEDFGRAGDITSAAVIPVTANAKAERRAYLRAFSRHSSPSDSLIHRSRSNGARKTAMRLRPAT